MKYDAISIFFPISDMFLSQFRWNLLHLHAMEKWRKNVSWRWAWDISGCSNKDANPAWLRENSQTFTVEYACTEECSVSTFPATHFL